MVSRRALQVVLAVLALIPLSNGFLTLALGTGRFGVDPATVDPEIDHTLRYLGGFYLGIALLIFYALRRIEVRGLLVVGLTGAIFLGGVGRLVSVLQVGAADSLQWVLIALELTLIAVIVPWQRHVAREALGRVPERAVRPVG